MVSGTPSNFAIACNTMLGIPQHPVPVVSGSAGAPVSATLPVTSSSIEVDAFGNDDYESGEEEDSTPIPPVHTVTTSTPADLDHFDQTDIHTAALMVYQRPEV